MNIKSLLLGSAAALVAVSGARAADAVMAEPEPVEYVRVCDAYGTGYFYIPGTETCLRFDGYVRYQAGARDDYNGRLEGWVKQVRTRLNVTAKSDTEWGTLTGFMRLQATWNGQGDGDVLADQAIVQLGGFYAGYTESVFAAPWGVPGIARFGILHTDNGGSYAYQQRAQMGYTFSGGNGFFGSIAMEDDALSGDGFVPDFTGSVGMSQGWGGVWAKGGYDESEEDGGVTVGVHFNVPNMPGSSLRVGGFWASGAGLTGTNAYAVSMPLSGTPAEWSVAGSYHHQFTSQIGAEIGAQYMEDFGVGDGYLVEAAIIWVPVTNFEVRLEGHYNNEEILGVADDDEVNGFLRFTRYF